MGYNCNGRLPAIALGLAAALSLSLAAQAQSDYYAADGQQATATMTVPCVTDTAEAIMLRDRYFRPPAGMVVVPNVFKVRGPGPQGGAQFESQADPVEELFHSGPFFPGPGYSGLTPGDPDVAVGPNHAIAVINGLLAFYNKSTGAQTFSASPTSFFAGLGTYSLIFDPRCFYDQYTGRFFINYDAYDASQHSYFLIAMSATSDPNGTWTKWAMDFSKNGSTQSGQWADYPGFGYTTDVLTWTANMFNAGYGKIRVAAKQQFLNGSPTITFTDFWNFTNPDGSLAYSLQPGRHIGTAVMPVIANVDSPYANIFGIQNPLTSPTLVKKSVTIASWSGPSSAVQKGTSTRVSTVDDRVYDVCVRDNKAVIAHNRNGGTGVQTQWCHVDCSSLPASVSLIQQGTVGTSSNCSWFAALQINGQGTIGTGYTEASSTEYVSLYYTGRLSTDTLGTMRSPTLKKASTTGYNGEANPCRWGDYCGGAVDPTDDFTFWGIGMLPVSTSSWTTEIFSYTIGSLPGTLTGNVSLQNFGSPTGQTANVEFRSPGTTTVLYSYPITLDASGNYSAGTVATGTFDVAVKFAHWLRDKTASKVIASGPNTVNFTQVNGDGNPDNIVDLLDLSTVLSNFGASGTAGDLDGSGIVDLLDLSIVLANFGIAGAS